MDTTPARHDGVDPLTAYALAGLRRCWMQAAGRWSHRYHLDGRVTVNESRPASDVYYSLNVLLGLAKVPRARLAAEWDAASLLASLCVTACGLPVRDGAWGMALWAAAALGMDAPGIATDRLDALTSDPSRAARMRAQDIGLSLSGLCAQEADAPRRQAAFLLRDHLLTRFAGAGPLFRDAAVGARRHVASFATQVYATLALYHHGERYADEVSLRAANRCVVGLMQLQGEQGEWPWFYSPATGRVVDRYEVYSVHQHGMAPAMLHHAVRHGVPGAREALLRGFEWIFGSNELGVSMLVPSLSLIYRSQARRGAAARRDMRLLRGAIARATGRGGNAAGASRLRLTQEMRSYEFGWLLWSFSGRTDYAACTHRPEFRLP